VHRFAEAILPEPALAKTKQVNCVTEQWLTEYQAQANALLPCHHGRPVEFVSGNQGGTEK
jgi:hypothetical protein